MTGSAGATAAVVLAAGGGRRFAAVDGRHKLRARWRGRALAWWAATAAVEAGIGPVWVVTGAVDLDDVLPDGVEVLSNQRWAEGQATSLTAAVARARRPPVRGGPAIGALVVGLGDQPLVPPAAWERVAAAAATPMAVATYAGRRANPVRLGRACWSLLPAEGDVGARHCLRDHPHLVQEVACPGDPFDVDTEADLDVMATREQWRI